jgi:hypothetical protein
MPDDDALGFRYLTRLTLVPVTGECILGSETPALPSRLFDLIGNARLGVRSDIGAFGGGVLGIFGEISGNACRKWENRLAYLLVVALQ